MLIFYTHVHTNISLQYSTHLRVWWNAVGAAALGNDDALAWPTRIHDGVLEFALEDSEVSDPAVPASKIASASPCRPCSLVTRPGPVPPAAAAAAAICHRDRGDRAHPGRRGGAVAAAAKPRRAACPAASLDATAW